METQWLGVVLRLIHMFEKWYVEDTNELLESSRLRQHIADECELGIINQSDRDYLLIMIDRWFSDLEEAKKKIRSTDE